MGLFSQNTVHEFLYWKGQVPSKMDENDFHQGSSLVKFQNTKDKE